MHSHSAIDCIILLVNAFGINKGHTSIRIEFGHIIYFYFCGSTVLIRTRASSHMRILELFRHMVGLLGRVIRPSQGLYLHRTTQHRKTRDKHPCLERDSNPRSQQTTGQDLRLRPHGHCDRQSSLYGILIFMILRQKTRRNILN
jgi:hypothetical protein